VTDDHVDLQLLRRGPAPVVQLTGTRVLVAVIVLTPSFGCDVDDEVRPVVFEAAGADTTTREREPLE
jgi:hypothetical protein